MTYAQRYYRDTSQREFAVNFKKLAPFLQEELNLIHRIQCNDNDKANLLKQYEKTYGAYELPHERKIMFDQSNTSGQMKLF